MRAIEGRRTAGLVVEAGCAARRCGLTGCVAAGIACDGSGEGCEASGRSERRAPRRLELPEEKGVSARSQRGANEIALHDEQ
mmetsp:Transcript_30664/g.62345  ORF Transcript_30664/g.62345 Transcript_30664/m.62345 type:complete len:82 (+) Transcript_30664:703-948(+)